MGALELAECHRHHRWCKVLPKLQQCNSLQRQLPCHLVVKRLSALFFEGKRVNQGGGRAI